MDYPPCKIACPIQTEAREYIQCIAERRFEDAIRAIKRQNPLPRVCGRICTHPCEETCKRGQVDEPVGIMGLKRFAADGPWGKGLRLPRAKGDGRQKVAVVGSGPAGLSAAHGLTRLGHPVTVFEKLPVLGGMMAVGIPAYRLSKDVLNDEIATIQDMDVEMRTGVAFGRDMTLQSLRDEGFGAVFLATGLHVSGTLQVPGEDLPGVLKGVDFLRHVALGDVPDMGKRVVVIGGGNVAVDVARTVLRLGAADVSMVALESEDEMPAWESEVEAAREEGVALLNCYGPKAFTEKNGRLEGIEFKYCSCVFDASGAFCPTYDESDVTGMGADTVIVAIGQRADLSPVRENGLAVTDRGGIQVDPGTLQTSVEGVFAGGDVVSGPATVTDAIAMGKRAATAIYSYLQGDPVPTPAVSKEKEIPALPAPLLDKARRFSRRRPEALPVQERIKHFQEVTPGLLEKDAVDEALRCLHCYLGARVDTERCISCLTCVRVCPFEIPRFNTDGEISIDPFQCQACGVCVAECPARAIDISLNARQKWRGTLAGELASLPQTGPVVVGFFDLHGRFGPADVEAAKEAFPTLLPRMLFGLGRMDVSDMLYPFQAGAQGVFLALCPEQRDPFPGVRGKIEARAHRARTLLENMGIQGSRLVVEEMPSHGLMETSWMDKLFAETESQKETGSGEEAS